MAATSTPRYVPLWCKSNFSFLEGASHPEELVDAATGLDLPAIALTDRNGVYGIVRAHTRIRETAAASGVPPRLIVGSEVTTEGGSIVLLVENRQGYANLCRLVSTGHLRNQKGRSSVTWEEVCAHAAGLVALWVRPETQDDRQLCALADAYAGRLFAVVSRHLWFDDVRREKETREHAGRLGIPIVAATEVLYHARERRRLQDVLTCIRHTVTLAEAGTRLQPNDQHALKSREEFFRLYRDEPALIERTGEIADRCTFSLAEIEFRYPDEAVPQGYSTSQWLRKLCADGAQTIYGSDVPEKVRVQVEKELSVIEDLRYSGYFLTMWEIVRYSREHGILCQGRGSAANSAVCYCLGITAIDPVRMDLLFERFLSRERAEPPDIDLDIEHRRREEVIQHMYSKYGRDRAAMVANVVRYRTRSAVREVGKVLGIQETTLDRCSKLLPHWGGGEISPILVEAGLDPAASVNRLLSDLSRELVGFPRHLSIHPGGFLLGSEPVTHIVPVENATMEDRTVIQWDKTDIEALNLFKVDLLGLGALTHLDYCFRLLRAHYDIELSMATIPAEDPSVFEMVRKSDTVGVFQIESRAQMAMLPRLKPCSYYDLVIEVSIVRPGPISGGMVHPYLRRRNGEETVTYPHPSLEPVLAKTLGIPLFQEQVMKLAVTAADYSPGEADQLRRDMAAWRQSGKIEQHREKLISRMMAKGIPADFAERVFEQIRGFGDYGFPESHAASFALIAYATAWMKCHHAGVFACALLNAWPMGFYFPSTIIDDAKRHGVRVLPVDVLASDWECILEKLTDGNHGIRVGLRYVKGLGEQDWDRIQDARKAHPVSVSAFSATSGLARDTLERLAESGAFECFGGKRRDALWAVLGSRPQPAETDAKVLGARLFSHDEGAVEFRELPGSQLINWDYSTTELSTRGHVVEPFRSRLENEGLPDASGVSSMKDGVKLSYAGYVICRQMPENAKGAMFMTLEDETGFVNVVVWSKVYSQHRTTILTNWFLGVTGHLQKAEGVTHVVAESFWKPDFLSSEAGHSAQSRDFR